MTDKVTMSLEKYHVMIREIDELRKKKSFLQEVHEKVQEAGGKSVVKWDVESAGNKYRLTVIIEQL